MRVLDEKLAVNGKPVYTRAQAEVHLEKWSSFTSAGNQSGGQFIATSHNPETIRSFSDENALVLCRKSHLEPTIVRPLSELQVKGDLVGALARGDLEP